MAGVEGRWRIAVHGLTMIEFRSCRAMTRPWSVPKRRLRSSWRPTRRRSRCPSWLSRSWRPFSGPQEARMPPNPPRTLTARQRGLGAFQGVCLAILPGLAIWIVVALVVWVVI